MACAIVSMVGRDDRMRAFAFKTDDLVVNNSVGINNERFDVRTYGAKCDGSTDDTTAIQNAINAADNVANIATGCGGTVVFPAGTCKITSQITFPTTAGGGLHQMCSLRLTGSGGHSVNLQFTPAGSTVLLLAANPGSCGVFCFIGGLGHVEMDHLTLYNTSLTNTAPMIYNTITTMHIHDISFIGAGSGTTCNQDAIVMGGTSQSTTDNTAASQFAGYGTVIDSNWMNAMRRFVQLGVNANTLQIHDNSIYAASGSNLANGAAIELIGLVTGGVSGNMIEHNYFEVGAYPDAIKLTSYATGNDIVGNTFYDPSGTTLAYHLIVDSTSTFNYIQSTEYSNAKTFVQDNSGGTSNTTITIQQSVISQIGTPWTFNNTVALAGSNPGAVSVPTQLQANCQTAGTCSIIVNTSLNKAFTLAVDTSGNASMTGSTAALNLNVAASQPINFKVGGTAVFQYDGNGNTTIFNGSGTAIGQFGSGGYFATYNGAGAFARIYRPTGHTSCLTPVPTINAACQSGVGSAITGCDESFFVTTGSTATACTITFANSFSTKPSCIAYTEGGTTLPTCTIAAGAITCSTVASATAYHFHCEGLTGSN